MCAYPMVGDEPVAVVLPDVILDEYSADPRKDNLHDMLQRFEATGVSQIMVEPVPHKDVGNYGVADCKGVDLQPGESAPMVSVVEKPSPDKAPSNRRLSVVTCCPPIFGRCWRKRLRAPATKFS